MSEFTDRILLAHRRSVPIVAITTADARATLEAVSNRLLKAKGGQGTAIVEWDLVQGVRSVSKAGRAWAEGLTAPDAAEDAAGFASPAASDPTIDAPAVFLDRVKDLPEGAVAFLHGAHRYLLETPESAAVAQAVANLRDPFKSHGQTLILLCPDIQLPAELQEDVVVFDEPLPTGEELGGIVDAAYRPVVGGKQVQLPLTPEHRAAAIDFVTGLSAFAADQALALAMTQQGCDLKLLRELRRRSIEQTPGLTICKSGEKYADVGGVRYAKEFFGKVLDSRRPPRAIIYVDEIEKALAGAAGAASDSSGVSQDILGTLLSFMEDHRCNGTICFGPPGCSKSLIAKATGNQGDVDTIQLDIGALKGSFVGESERNIRRALKVIHASAAGRSYWIATCNAVKPLPGPLLRRFTHGILFFDLPDEEERQAIWRVHIKALELTGDQVYELPDDQNWTGADVRNCCELASEFRIDLKEASRYLLPVAVSHPALVEQLRKEAGGHYKSASNGEIYRRPRPPKRPKGRALEFAGDANFVKV